jgi:hypothetical protein
VSAIKSGDIVMVVRDCCGRWVGKVFTAGEDLFGEGYCEHCKYSTNDRSVRNPEWASIGQIFAMPVKWLKRIKPLDELERDQIVDELTCG